jgi:DNA repair protein RecN (Recombination protein N)
LIFDEVDTGIGGAVAERVGRLLQQLAADRQVFAITHLPQVASKGARHIVVRKVSTDNAVVSQIDYVDGEQRVREIARMIAGEQITNASLNHASELLST